MNVEYRVLYKFQWSNQYLPVYSSFWGLLVNTTGMENAHICWHFASLQKGEGGGILFLVWVSVGMRVAFVLA